MDNIDNDALLTIITKLKNTVQVLSENVCLKSEHWYSRCYKLLLLISKIMEPINNSNSE